MLPMDAPQWLLGLSLLFLILGTRSGMCTQLLCRCNEGRCDGPENNGTCLIDTLTVPNEVCTARYEPASQMIQLSCLTHGFNVACNPKNSGIAPESLCCSSRPFCNEDLVSLIPIPTTILQPTPVPTMMPMVSTMVTTDSPVVNQVYRQVTIAIPVVSALLIVLIIVGTPTLLCLLRYRKMRIEHLRDEQHNLGGGKNQRDPSPLYSPYSLDTLDLEDTCTSGSGSGEPLLSQRTIARSIVVGEPIGSGRFGQVFIGEFQGDLVAVKKFASRDEKSWFRESEVYNTVLLRHDNILGFFASDVYSSNGITELWLITQYHANGSLYDYLNRTTVTPKIMMRMVITICKGLTHLHTEFTGTSAKPAIAHRDMKSKNILVKNTLECCIADFGLAVMKGPSSNVNFPTNPKQGTKRYMAPEVLKETINMSNFECFMQVDIYAFGLIMWEICKRCGGKNDCVGEYEPPYHGMVGADPSFEEIKKVVVMDRKRPAIPSHWRNDDLLSGLKDLMAGCWYEDGDARNKILFYKAKLINLAREDKMEYDVQE